MADDSSEPSRGYSREQISEFHRRLQELRNETVGIQLISHDLSQLLTKQRARVYANEGVGRRLKLIARSAENVFKSYPPGMVALMTSEDCDDIAIQLHAFAINVYAILDNIAWVCMLEAGGELPPLNVGLFKKSCQPYLPPDLLAYVQQDTTKNWFDRYGKVYRDSTAHRIPIYLPSRAYTVEESQRFTELHTRSHQLLIEASQTMLQDRTRGLELLDSHEALLRQKECIGSNSLLVALSLNEKDPAPPVYMHPQILCDWGLANEIVRIFDSAMRKHYGWPISYFPPVVVC
jgi:hypothetical protein